MSFAHRAPEDLAYPRYVARTQGGRLGMPRSFTVSRDGRRVVFLRSRAGDDRVMGLWLLDVETGTERCLFDPRATGAGEGDLTSAERARRERLRESGRGVTAYACDDGATRAVFSLGGRLVLVDLGTGAKAELPSDGAPDDPRLSPEGSAIASVVDGRLFVQDAAGGAPRLVVAEADADPDVRWGLPDFAASEELQRHRGFWWSPDGRTIAACRVDERKVERWWLSEPGEPGAAPRAIRYPRAGTANADVSLHLLDVEGGRRVEVAWDRERFEYLVSVTWSAGNPLTLLVLSRDQRDGLVLAAAEDGSTRELQRIHREPWIEIVAGLPDWLDGKLLGTVEDHDTRRLAWDGEPVTPPGLHVRGVLAAGSGEVWLQATGADTSQQHVWRVMPGSAPEQVTTDAGVHVGAMAGGTFVRTSWLADDDLASVAVISGGREQPLASAALPPEVHPSPRFAELGARQLPGALLLPAGREPDGALPVLLSPYGGPHGQRVLRHRGGYRTEQWLADRLGVAVLVVDGRGTPARGLAWEHAVHRDFSVTLDDQIHGLQAAAERWPFLDPTRAAIRGWSFGGMLAALALLERPDVFHAAVAGAPVTDQRLYDTAYTERYLGDPRQDAGPYVRSSPISRVATASPHRRLLLVHGLSDDNVHAAHTLQLSAALLAEGYAHDLLLLQRASHMGGMEEQLVGQSLAELDFLRRWREAR